ncbi:aspartate aminotransferase family protein [Cellulosilyticum sp. I15G10I2]|uniref:aspartate aminotransferase family protein n=1 Tax=Cellulosilyticum sp. I15G10I2 TaxID=1892843 RepID=UPI00085C87F3|nr:aspartate aminotransferase family protein [Cellulosilyticum sp. I15G10I2]
MSGYVELGQKYVMNSYNRFPIVVTYGEDVYVYDDKGKKYLDMCAGIAVNALGYSHPALSAALKEQVDKLLHISNLYYIPQQIEAAKLLVENSLFDKVFFCNSGAEANEAALKLARKYGKNINEKKTKVITMNHSFHGRTYGALSATGQTKYQKNFMPVMEGFSYAEYNNIDSFKELIDQDTCAVLIEVIQGEGGIIPGNKEYLQEVQKICHAYDALLMIDEVQTGIGRTGTLFAFENFDLQPDVITLAKALGSGVPIGAMLCTSKADVFVPADHASTFGGNPLATTAAKVVLEELIQKDLLSHVKEVGAYLEGELVKLKESFDVITDVRGMGLMQGIELKVAPKEVVSKCIEKGMLVVGAGENVVRFVPPLVINKEQIDECISILKESLKEL